jgi:hypothetical protein
MCRVLHFQAIARDVGPREMTVRQMLHAATLRSRQPTMSVAAADQLVRLSDLDDGAALSGQGPQAPHEDEELGAYGGSKSVAGDDSSNLRAAEAGSLSGPSSSHRSMADGNNVRFAGTSCLRSVPGTGKDADSSVQSPFANGR